MFSYLACFTVKIISSMRYTTKNVHIQNGKYEHCCPTVNPCIDATGIAYTQLYMQLKWLKTLSNLGYFLVRFPYNFLTIFSLECRPLSQQLYTEFYCCKVQFGCCYFSSSEQRNVCTILYKEIHFKPKVFFCF